MNDSVHVVAPTDGEPPPQDHIKPASAAMGHARSAGDLLRHAREQAGVNIETLAAALKVPVRKLQALESNQWEQLADATFARALASSVARHLKLDPAIVLAALPTNQRVPLVISNGLGKATPANGGAGQRQMTGLRWLVGVLLLGAVGLYVAPQLLSALGVDAELGFSDSLKGESTAQPDSAASASVVSIAATEEPVSVTDSTTNVTTPAGLGAVAANEMATPNASAAGTLAQPLLLPGVTATGSALSHAAALPPDATTGNAAAAANVMMRVQATADSWLEVRDETGRLRIQRLLTKGEQLVFEEGPTYNVVVGNAAATQVEVRGKALDLLAMTKNNVVRFEAK